jgi:chromosome partitioning protein
MIEETLPGGSFTMKKFAIGNQKGGTGKTTTAVNLAAALSRKEKKVLLVDLDPQASLTEYFVSPSKVDNLGPLLYDGLLHGATVTPYILGDFVSLVATNIDLAAAEIELPTKLNQERTLSRWLRPFDSQYDYCLIDCPPSLGVLSTNALAAARWVIVPVACELMAERTLKLILNRVDDVRDTEVNTELHVWRILPTNFDTRLAHHREILEAIKTKHGDLVYSEPTKATTKYKDAVTEGTDISDLDAKHGEYWDRLAEELITTTRS